MKNLLIDFRPQNGNSFASFSAVTLDKKTIKELKGGEDIIIVEDVIIG